MQKDKLVPDIRFKGFEEEWNNLYLFQLIKYAKSGGTPNTANVDFWNGNIPFLTIADLKNKTYISQTAKSITQLGLHSSSAWIVPSGALVLSIYATIGKSAILSCDMATSQAFISILTNNDSASFLHRIFERMDLNGAWSSLQSTGTQSNLNANIIKNLVIKYPKSKSEIDIISNLFENIDDLISMHELKLEKLQTIKQSLLNKMFASYDQKTPEIRFKIFNREWKISRLSEFGKCLSGYGFPISEQGNQGGIPFYKVSDMNINENYLVMNVANNYVSSDVAKDKGWKINSSLPAILFAKVGAAVMLNRKRITFIPFLIDNNMMSYSSNGILDNSFLYYIFYRINLPDLVQCGALPSINASDVLNMQVLISDNIYEQQKIGQFFSSLDSLIHSQEQKLEKLNNIKQALLEKMFC
ncbi:restriction endonuclease subunit S [Mycoplasma sp. Z631]